MESFYLQNSLILLVSICLRFYIFTKKIIMSKYLFDENELSKELITLLAVLQSSKDNHNFFDPIAAKGELLPIFFTEWRIIQESLIASAIKLRMIDDRFKDNSIKPSIYFSNVGSLQKGSKNSDLSFRTACNKIIHAIKFIPQTEPDSEPERNQWYTKKIRLEGEYDGKWKAEIDIEKYVCEGLLLIKQYDENWNISSR